MPNRDIIVIGASAGGVEALSQLISKLPADLSASLFVVVHFPSDSTSVLPHILNRLGRLHAVHPQDQEVIQYNHIYVAPPDYHLVLEPQHIRLTRGPRENGHRPAIDTLFRSAAHAYQRRVIGVILSGSRDDGTVGLAVIKQYGGLAIAQDPEEALFNSMPRSAIEQVEIDYILKITEITSKLIELVNHPINPLKPMSEPPKPDSEVIFDQKAALEQGDHRSNIASMFTCPDCGGVLWELQDNNLLRFRCHVGHAYSMDSLIKEQSDDVERALWSAIRALEEKASLARRMANQAREHNYSISESRFLERAQEAHQQAALVRQIILQHQEANIQEYGDPSPSQNPKTP